MDKEEIKEKLNVNYFLKSDFTNNEKQRILWVKYFELSNKFFVYRYNFLEFCSEIFETNYNELK